MRTTKEIEREVLEILKKRAASGLRKGEIRRLLNVRGHRQASAFGQALSNLQER